ncbi:GGDEF domain-containing protein [Thetidibacter halocola]|uniref:GGDEF domain-containing protein n=1 Tax=Thetidibacter halocola TaxID=2827239 RepID=A0A8J7WHV3_9RHOB|nr:GGDEF domain-containing protein [Thetidibacter halocola]MBS0125398.1 GGDEF domain-containing protein [Thetidibacter halocola]
MMERMTPSMLDSLCPLHVMLDRSGFILRTGPTLAKLDLGLAPGKAFLTEMEVLRPRQVETMAQLHDLAGRKLHIRQSSGFRTQFKGAFVPDGHGGGVVDLSFGIFVQESVRRFGLTSRDFSPTDMSVEMLYVIEANSAAMESSRRLNNRLQTAMFAAEERALTDMLTGLGNRRALELVQSRLHRAGGDYALMHLDLDFFKQVNDSLGHAAGDRVLRAVSRAMLSEIRKDDMVARIGGDEFVIIFMNAMTSNRLADVARRLIGRIEKPIDVDGEQCAISASIGIAQCQAAEFEPEEVLKHADIALYTAKREGRGRHSFYDPEAAIEKDEVPRQIADG